MVKLSELRTAEEIHQEDMRDPEYVREYERTKLANEVALAVIRYRAEHHLSQAALGRKLGMRQPAIARSAMFSGNRMSPPKGPLGDAASEQTSPKVEAHRPAARTCPQNSGNLAPRANLLE